MSIAISLKRIADHLNELARGESYHPGDDA